MSIGLLNHHVKKGSKISGGDDGPGPEPIPQALVLLTVSIDNIYYVIQFRCWCRDQRLSFMIVISGEKGVEYS